MRVGRSSHEIVTFVCANVYFLEKHLAALVIVAADIPFHLVSDYAAIFQLKYFLFCLKSKQN